MLAYATTIHKAQGSAPSQTVEPNAPDILPEPVEGPPGDFQEEPGAGKPHARICEGEAVWPSYSTTTPGLS